MVGLCHWLAARSLLHGLHPALDGLQDLHYPGDTQRGRVLTFKELFIIVKAVIRFIAHLLTSDDMFSLKFSASVYSEITFDALKFFTV